MTLRLLRGLAAAAALLAVAWCLVLLSIFLFGRLDEAREVDAVIVLGAAQYDGRPSPVLQARLDHAIELYGRGFAPRLIVTGGVGVGDTVSEADVGMRYAVRKGIPPDDILIERSGVSSDESLTAVTALMDANQLESALLVSDPFHMLRLRLLAARLGLRAYSSPTRSSPISVGSAEEWRHVAREGIILPGVLVKAIRPGLPDRIRGADNGTSEEAHP